MSAAARVGILVILFVVLGAMATNFLRLDAGPDSQQFTAVFDDAGGLTPGSKITLSGVEVGRVGEVGLNEEGRAFAKLDIKKEVKVRKGVEAIVPTSLVSIGVSELRLVQPANANAQPKSQPIPGRVEGALDDMIPDLEPTLEEVNRTLVAVQGLIGDEGLRTELKNTLVSGQRTADSFGKLATRMDRLIAQNQAQVSTALVTASAALQDMRVVSREIAELVESGELQGKTLALLESMDEAVQTTTQLVADVKELANDPEMRLAMKETLENVKIASESGPRIAADAEVMAANGAEVSAEAVALMKRANSMAEKVDNLIDKFNGTLDSIGGDPGNLIPKVTLEADVTRVSDPNRIRADVTAEIPVGGERLRVGFYDAFESNKLTAQLARRFGPKTDLRYGIYAGKPGAGVDYQIGPKVGLRADVFGLNDTQFDGKLRYDLGQGAVGWFGVEDIFRRNRLAVGVGIRR